MNPRIQSFVRSFVGLLALCLFALIATPTAHAQGAGNGDLDLPMHDGSYIVDYANLTSSAQSDLIHAYSVLGLHVPLGLLAANIQGYYGTEPFIGIGSTVPEDYDYINPNGGQGAFIDRNTWTLVYMF